MQKSSRSTRALRGVAVAFFATFVSLASHVVAGGSIHGILNIALPLSLSLMFCILLSGKRLSLWRISAMVGFSQILFHLLFSMGSSASTASLTEQAGLGHHDMSMSLDMSNSASASMMNHGDNTMLAAHIFAGLATMLVLQRSEQLLIVISEIIDLFTWKLLWRLIKFVYQPVLPEPIPSEPREVPSYTVAIYATSVIRRGPPVLTLV